jgi:GT2 family glycosyltransferase
MTKQLPLTIVIPTYSREQVLVETLSHLLNLDITAEEIIVIDQTAEHETGTIEALSRMAEKNQIRWIRLPNPSIPHAMNVGLLEARHDIVLFLDDDIMPEKNLVAAHQRAYQEKDVNIVAGQVLQQGEEILSPELDNGSFRFCSGRRQWVTELMGGNFSAKRETVLRLGGFDENFVQVAYRFEAEFSDRAMAAGEKILFEPAAGILHLKAARGGTRAFGEHLTTIKPGHAVGAYYYLLRSGLARQRLRRIVSRPLRAIGTRHHLRRPWWIPVTLIAEMLGLCWAVSLYLRGPILLRTDVSGKTP